MIRARAFSAQLMLALCLFAGAARADGGDEPWEPHDAVSAPTDDGEPDLLRAAARAAIRTYRERVGPKSVKRCPFAVSCSVYADGLVKRYGVFGLLGFVDRFFFREHPLVMAFYELAVTNEGTLYLDDHALRTE